MPASPPVHQRLPRIGGMATMSTRKHTFALVLERILPQLDRLYLFFDAPGDTRGDAPKTWAAHPKITPLFPSTHGDFHGYGKFLGAELFGAPCIYVCFDDDIAYPPDYVERLCAALGRYGNDALAGFHAGIFRPPYLSYVRHRDFMHFQAGSESDCVADTLGTGTVAFSTARFRFHPRDWPHHHMGDLLLAIEAAKQGLRRIAVKRPKDYLMPLEHVQADSLYARLTRDEALHVHVMRQALKTYPRAWHLGGIGVDGA